MQEGKQYFVNRITFVGNTTTRDNVIRREMRLVENGVFNTEALKYSVKRLNQLGYFKPLEGRPEDSKVEKTPGAEEQGRRQAEVRGAEPQPAHLRRRRVAVRRLLRPARRSRRRTSSAAARALTFVGAGRARARRTTSSRSPSRSCSTGPSPAGVDIFKREIQLHRPFTQESTGGNLDDRASRCSDFTRLFVNYSYEQVEVKDVNPRLPRPGRHRAQPVPGRLAAARRGRQADDQQDHAEHRPQHGRQPDLPDAGQALHASLDLAGLGGNTNFFKPRVEGVWYLAAHAPDDRFGFRGAGGVHPARTAAPTRSLPIFEQLFLGGEYSVRGYDIRTIGPRDPVTGRRARRQQEPAVQRRVPDHDRRAGARLVLFYDAGQVQGLSARRFALATSSKTSTGAEVRFFMPVLNVPFRLIFAAQPAARGHATTTTCSPPKEFTFRFAVGSTF